MPAARRSLATSRVLRAEQDGLPGAPSPAAAPAAAKPASSDAAAAAAAAEAAPAASASLALPGSDAAPPADSSSSAAAAAPADPPRSPFIMPGSEVSLDPFRQAPRRPALRNQETCRLHIQSTRNNIILTLTTMSGNIICSSSGGAAGFKKAARGEYEAGYRAALAMFKKIEDSRIRWGVGGLELVWKGFGKGREAAFRALLTQEGQATRSLVTSMRDATAIKIGGVRPRKRRSEYIV